VHTGGPVAALNEHLNALWYIMLNGPAWRALPSEFGNWGAIYQYFNRLSLAGFFEFLEQKMICGDKAEAVFKDSTHHKVHQHANGCGRHQDQAIGRSRGGLNTKLHLLVDACGRLAGKIILTSGDVSDHTVAPELTEKLEDTASVGDKGYDSKKLREQLRSQGCEPCIPARSNVKNPESYDKGLYRTRHCVENKFQRLKVFRRVASRYEKTKRMFYMFVIVAFSVTYEKDNLWPPL
jgi:transposase